MENRNSPKSALSCSSQTSDNHKRCVIHVDIDCFYAQVEMIRKPELRSRPLGIQQKNIIVTSNYVAREYGVQKCMPVAEGLRLCPALLLVRGEDLTPYRHMSAEIFNVLKTFNCPVEKLGMDENYLDVTELVNSRAIPEGGGRDEDMEGCDCGCAARLNSAANIASEIQDQLKARLGLSCSAGIAHNKLLAKLAGGTHKPAGKTVLLPGAAPEFMEALGAVKAIPGIGTKTAETLNSIGFDTVRQLQNADLNTLKKTFSDDIAVKLKNLSLGIDNSDVKMSGKPLSIGLEDSFRPVSVESEVRDKFSVLVSRLVCLAREDGRLPTGLRVTIRRGTPPRPPTRHSRHCNISPSLFTSRHGSLDLADGAQQKLLTIIMRLFVKLVDLTKPFHLTLIGLAFTKFQERKLGRSSIADYLMNDVSVQSVMSIQSDADSSVASMDCSSLSSSASSDVSDTEREPVYKKVRQSSLLHLRSASPSPSKLRVAEMHLGNHLEAVESECPPGVDPEVFSALPDDVQRELRASWLLAPTRAEVCHPNTTNKDRNTITRYFIPNKQ